MYLVDDLAECLCPENSIKWMTRQYKPIQIKYLSVKSVCHYFLKTSLKRFAVRNQLRYHKGQPNWVRHVETGAAIVSLLYYLSSK